MTNLPKTNEAGLEDAVAGLSFGAVPHFKVLFQFLTVIFQLLRAISLSMTYFPTGVGVKDTSASTKNANTMPTTVEFAIEAMTLGHDLRASRLKIKHKARHRVIQGSHGRSH